MLHVLHAVFAQLGVDVWFEYVPSKCNISDGPSRGERDLLELEEECLEALIIERVARQLAQPARNQNVDQALEEGRTA